MARCASALFAIALMSAAGCVASETPPPGKAGKPGAAAETLALRKPAELASIERGMIGFNSPMGGLGEPKGRYQSRRMDQAFAILPMQALRYPGGTVANYFDWGSETLIEDALRKSGKDDLLQSQLSRRRANKGQPQRIDLASFYAFTDEHEIRRYMVLNLLSSTVEATIETVDRVKAKYPGRYYWEFGNELSQGAYRKRAYSTETFNEKVYVEVAERIANHISSRYPEDRTGVVIAQRIEGRVPAPGGLKRLQRERNDWDQAVVTLDKADAVIVHPYVNANRRFLKRLPADESGAATGDERRWRWIFSSAQELPRLYVERIEERFPGKKIWITEAGLVEDHGDGIAAQQRMSRFLFDLAYFVAWLAEYPAWESFLYHGLFAGKGHMAAFGPDMDWNANTVAYAMLARFLDGGARAGVLQLAGAPVYDGVGFYSDTSVRALSGAYVEKKDGDAILLVNTGSQPVALQLPFTSADLISVGGSVAKLISATGFDDETVFRRARVAGRSFTIAPYTGVLITEAD